MIFKSWDFNETMLKNLAAYSLTSADIYSKMKIRWDWRETIDGVNVYSKTPDFSELYQECNYVQCFYHIAKWAEYSINKIEQDNAGSLIVPCEDGSYSGSLYGLIHDDEGVLKVTFNGVSSPFEEHEYPSEILSGSLISNSELDTLISKYNLNFNYDSSTDVTKFGTNCGYDCVLKGTRTLLESLTTSGLWAIERDDEASVKTDFINWLNGIKNDYLYLAERLTAALKDRSLATTDVHIALLDLGILPGMISNIYEKGRVANYASVSNIYLDMSLGDGTDTKYKYPYSSTSSFSESELLALLPGITRSYLYEKVIHIHVHEETTTDNDGNTTTTYENVYFLRTDFLDKVTALESTKIFEYMLNRQYIYISADTSSWLGGYVAFAFRAASLYLATSSAGATYGLSLVLWADAQSDPDNPLLPDDVRIIIELFVIYQAYMSSNNAFNAATSTVDIASREYFKKRQKDIKDEYSSLEQIEELWRKEDESADDNKFDFVGRRSESYNPLDDLAKDNEDYYDMTIQYKNEFKIKEYYEYRTNNY